MIANEITLVIMKSVSRNLFNIVYIWFYFRNYFNASSLLVRFSKVATIFSTMTSFLLILSFLNKLTKIFMISLESKLDFREFSADKYSIMMMMYLRETSSQLVTKARISLKMLVLVKITDLAYLSIAKAFNNLNVGFISCLEAKS